MRPSRCLSLLVLCVSLSIECRAQFYESKIGEPLRLSQFRSAEAVAVDANGNVYIADGISNMIHKFDANGTPVLQWGSYGSGDGQFKISNAGYDVDLAVDINGNIYVADGGNHRIQKFSPNGTFITKWGSAGFNDGQFSGSVVRATLSIAVDVNGNVYVADAINKVIQKFSSDGMFITKWAGSSSPSDEQVSSPYGIAVAGGNVFVSDGNQIKKYSSTGTFITKWGSQGSGNGQFSAARGIAVEASGNVYVADHYNHRIQKFSSDGTFIAKWGSAGSNDGQFEYPQRVAVDPNGNVYVMEARDINSYINGRIQKFSPTGTFIGKLVSQSFDNGQLSFVYGTAVDASGNVYVADYYNHRVQKFSADGTFIRAWGSRGSGNGQFLYPRGVGVDTGGNVYVLDAENYRIQKFSSDGTFITKWGSYGAGDGQFNLPEGIAVDPNGFVYVIEGMAGRIIKFSSSGAFITKWSGSGNGQFAFSRGIAADATGNVYVADRSSNRVHKFSSDGSYVATLVNSRLVMPNNLAIDAKGNLYVSDEQHRILKFSVDGTYIGTWGSEGSAQGQFGHPEGIAVDANGNVYVADSHNNRIQKFASLTISSISPGKGLAGSTVTINGSGFSPVPAENVVKINGTNASITSATKTSLLVTVPATATTGKISVARETTTTVSDNEFLVLPLAINSFSPGLGPAGTSVVITGSGFSGVAVNNIVKFNGVTATVTNASPNSLTASIPTGNTAGKISVTVNGTTATSSEDFGGILSLTTVTPPSASVGASVTLTGTGFSSTLSNQIVRFNGVSATITSATPTSLTVTIPTGTTTGKISVTREEYTVESVNEFLVSPLAITSLSPPIGGIGLNISIIGTGFSSTPGNNLVKFNGGVATVLENSPTQLKVVVPDGATNGKVTVTTLGQTASSSSDFRITPLLIERVNFASYYSLDETSATATVTINDIAHIQAAYLRSRGITADDDTYSADPVPLPTSGNTLTFTIPASYFNDPIGLRGYFLFVDSNGNEVSSEAGHIHLRYPASATTHAIPNLIFGNQQKDYQLISIPLELADKKVNSVFKALGNYDITKYRLYSSTGSSNFELSGNSSLTVGRGYWLIAKNKTEIIPGEGTTVLATEENPFVIELNPGANLIGNPYNFNVQWSDVLEYNNNPENVGNLIHFKNGTVGTTPVLERYRGAFVRVTGNDPVSLKIPVRKNNTVNGGRMKTTPPSPLDAPSWSLPLTVDDGIIRNELIGIGMHPEANESVDRWDILDIPIPIDAFTISMRETPEGTVINDVVTTSPHYTWHGQLDSHNGVTLSWDNSFFGDNDKHLVLEIEGQAQLINMRSFTQTFVPRGSQTFFIHYGNEEYIKSETLTEQVLTSHVYPNPFNKNSESIQIAMALPKGTTTVHLSLIDTKGKTAALSPEAQFDEGRRLITWKNDYSLLSSGLYLLRIAVTDKSGPQYFYKKLLIE